MYGNWESSPSPPGQLCHPQPQPGSPSPSCPYPEVIEVGSSLTGKVSAAGSSHLLETRGSPPTVPILGGTDPFERAWGALTVLFLPPHFMGPQFPGPMNMSPCLGKGTLRWSPYPPDPGGAMVITKVPSKKEAEL